MFLEVSLVASHGTDINVLIITTRNLIKVIRQHFDDFKPTHSGVEHCHAGETTIIINDIASYMMLSYRPTIWAYHTHMHRIPQS